MKADAYTQSLHVKLSVIFLVSWCTQHFGAWCTTVHGAFIVFDVPYQRIAPNHGALLHGAHWRTMPLTAWCL